MAEKTTLTLSDGFPLDGDVVVIDTRTGAELPFERPNGRTILIENALAPFAGVQYRPVPRSLQRKRERHAADTWPQAAEIAAAFAELSDQRRADLAALIGDALDDLYWKTVADLGTD